MHYKLTILAFATMLITGCAAPIQKIDTSAQFDKEQAQSLLSDGTNNLKGSALIRQRGGGVVSCAGYEVTLIPVTEYASERMRAIYGSTERGFRSAGMGSKRIAFNDEPPEFKDLVRKTNCDAQGYFKFDKISNGDFYISTSIVWKVNDYFLEGGVLMRHVSFSGGESKDIVLSP